LTGIVTVVLDVMFVI